jgi:hypothetical protein
MVKVQWKHIGPNEATWEMEDDMKQAYPCLFNFVHTEHINKYNIEDNVPLMGSRLQYPLFPLDCKYNCNFPKYYGGLKMCEFWI